MRLSTEKLKEMLVESGLVEPGDFNVALDESMRTRLPLDTVLVQKKFIPDDYLGQMVADELGFPFARLGSADIPDHVLRTVPERVAKKKGALAFGIDPERGLKVAMRNPNDLEFVRNLEKKTGVRVIPHYVTADGLEHGLDYYTKDLEGAIKNLDIEQIGDGSKEAAKHADEDRVMREVDLVMDYAYQNNASDIHIEPREDGVMVRYRVDGILHDVATLPKEHLNALTTRIKVMSRLRTDEHFAAQDGKFQMTVGGERVDVRVSVLPIVDGEKVVMRLLTEKGKNFGLGDIGLGKNDLKTLRKHARKSFGMILATGPTGSGKTTSLYALLKELNTRDVNIATIEDPIEYSMEGVNQIQVNVKTGLTFASGLRSIVRQDPDIIMVGEIRDAETAGIAVNAAMTGHLVLSTLHTNDAATTLPRFREMQVEPFLIASTINVIVAQRLVRIICGKCIMSDEVKTEKLLDFVSKEMLLRHFADEGGKLKETISAYRGKGCEACNNTGFRGRLGIFEVLEMNDEIRELIMQNANSRVIQQKAMAAGMTTMLDDGLRKVAKGMTTFDEVLRVTGEM